MWKIPHFAGRIVTGGRGVPERIMAAMKTRASRLAQVKFVALPMPTPAPAARRRGRLATLLHSLFRVFGCLEAARP